MRLRNVDAAIRDHDDIIVRWLTGKLGDPDTARDVAQSAYLRVWRFAQDGEVENAKALLFKTAANLAANEFRARSVRRQVERAPRSGPDGHNEIDLVPSFEPTPEDAASVRSDARLSADIVRAMPDKVRRTFIMSRFEERTYEEIATDLGVTVSSIEKYMITALRILRAGMSIETKDRRGAVVAFPVARRTIGGTRDE